MGAGPAGEALHADFSTGNSLLQPTVRYCHLHWHFPNSLQNFGPPLHCSAASLTAKNTTARDLDKGDWLYLWHMLVSNTCMHLFHYYYYYFHVPDH